MKHISPVKKKKSPTYVHTVNVNIFSAEKNTKLLLCFTAILSKSTQLNICSGKKTELILVVGRSFNIQLYSTNTMEHLLSSGFTPMGGASVFAVAA